MARGGSRPGAGRRPGSANVRTREIADRAAGEGVTPLEFMLNRMRDESAPIADRMDMAKAAAPFIHARLSSIEAKVEADVKASVRKIERTLVDPKPADA